jgi:hypothetical protein
MIFRYVGDKVVGTKVEFLVALTAPVNEQAVGLAFDPGHAAGISWLNFQKRG